MNTHTQLVIVKGFNMKTFILKLIITLLVISNCFTAYSYAQAKYEREQSICTKAQTAYDDAKQYTTSKFNNLFN